MAVRTTVVGSWWPLADYETALRAHHGGKLSPAESEQTLSGAAAAAIQQQIDLGIDEWTGGEYFTDTFVYHMHKMLTGIEVDQPEAADPFDYDDIAHAKVTGEIAAPNGLGYVTAYLRESKLPGGVRKAAVVSPYEIAVHSMDQMAAIQLQMASLTRIVNQEMRALADAGCPNVTLDAPIFGVQINKGLMTADEVAAVLAPCFEGVDAKRTLHFCNGNMRGRPMSGALYCRPWVDILERLEGVIEIASFECKYISQWQEREAFKAMPKSIELAAGIVDEGSYWVEPVAKIRDRLADWARVVGEERLWLSPSCGFGRHPLRDVPVLKAKVENMVEAARTL
jgi:methionine synthase II (cobalamin-independent)